MCPHCGDHLPPRVGTSLMDAPLTENKQQHVVQLFVSGIKFSCLYTVQLRAIVDYSSVQQEAVLLQD